MSETAAKQPPPVHLLVRLEVPDKPDKEFSYDFRKVVITLGRDPSNDIQIPLTTVSRHHARIFYELGDYFLEDLNSTHGTEHNGKKLGRGEKRLLRDGDVVRVMSFTINFKTTAGTMLDRQPGEKTEQLARRMVQEMLSSLGGSKVDPPALRVMNGVDEGRRFELSDQAIEITIGRSPDCDITLNDQNISRRHCLIKRNWHGFTAQDLGSKNGVVVNGRRTEGAEMIKDGDEIQIGGVKMIFIDPPSRLLEQIGGDDNATMDPVGVRDTDGSDEDAVRSGAVPMEPEAEDVEEDEPDPIETPDPPVASSEMDALEGVSRADSHATGGGQLAEMDAELAKVSKKGAAWDVLILVFGALFLLGAVGLLLFLFL